MSGQRNLIQSSLNGFYTADNITVELRILRTDIDPAWSLEVINSDGNFRVWDSLYSSDEQAYAEFKRALEKEGIEAFFDDGKSSNVIPFPI